MFPGIEYIKTCLNGLRSKFDKLERNISLIMQENKELIKESTADYTENDSNSNSYIKNRPFYDNRKFGKTMEVSVAIGGLYAYRTIDDDIWKALTAPSIPVVRNGNILYEYAGLSGNDLVYNAEYNNNINVMYVSSSEPKAYILDSKAADGAVTGSVLLTVTEVLSGELKKIENTYLPKTILKAPDGKKYIIIVDNTGKLSTEVIN